MKRWLKTELHSHTVDDPVEGPKIILYSARRLIDAAAQRGFEVLSITNHNQMLLDKGTGGLRLAARHLVDSRGRGDFGRKARSSL